MMLTEFLVFLVINCFLIVIALWKKIGMFSLFGMLFTLLMLPLSLDVVVYRNEVYGSTLQVYQVKANPTLMALICIMLIVIHAFILIKIKSG